jgi:uncharacterized membrane protein YeiB
VAPAFLLGIWAARRRVLEDPVPHRGLLCRVAITGTGLAVIGGVPLMLIDIRIWTPSDPVAVSAYALHSVTGIAGGLAYAAIIGLVVGRMRRGHPGPVVRALAACGQWSLTCYLLQSVVFVAVFAPYTGGLGTRVGDAAASGIAVVTWLATVVLAARLAPGGRRGPAETALRRLTYAGSRAQAGAPFRISTRPVSRE